MNDSFRFTKVSSFFYKRKLILYNLTAHRHQPSKVTSGRAGNDIASGFIAILTNVVEDHPEVTDIVYWSDSCVPQNRNSYISNAILEFQSKNKKIKTVTMKCSLTGHSCVQEVDNMHNQIEDAMRAAAFYSLISFIRVLLKVNHPYRVKEMAKGDFKDYMNVSNLLQFNLIPFMKVL